MADRAAGSTAGASSFAILGGGNGGFCTAADLALRGFEVRLFELPAYAHTVEPVIQEGGIALRGVAGEGFARLALVTTEIGSALEGAEMVMVVVPAVGHKIIARACAPHLKPDQTVVLTPGCCGGAIEFRRELKARGCPADVIVAESTSLMYAVKKEGGHRVWARGVKRGLPLAALPTGQTAAVIERLRPAFPQFVPALNVLDTSFNNSNHMTHPPVMLMNIGFVEGRHIEEWLFYHDGYTPGTGRVGERLDAERLAVVRAFGLPQVGILEWVRRYYGHLGMEGGSLHEMFSTSPVHGATKGPRNTQSRLLTEDIPYGLVPLASFARAAGVPTPTMDALITLAGIVNETDYWESGRTVASLGLLGMTVAKIVQYVTNG
jgi:opine dehydrogenase